MHGLPPRRVRERRVRGDERQLDPRPEVRLDDLVYVRVAEDVREEEVWVVQWRGLEEVGPAEDEGRGTPVSADLRDGGESREGTYGTP